MNIAITQFAVEEGQEEVASGVGALGIDPKAFVIQLITFLLVYLILRKYVFKKIVDSLQKRQETIDKGVRLTTELTSQKEALDREAAEVRREARREAAGIVAGGQAQATQILKDAESSAQAKAGAIVAEAHKKAADETKRARRELESEMVELVIQATEKVTNQKLDAQKDNNLITQALKGQA